MRNKLSKCLPYSCTGISMARRYQRTTTAVSGLSASTSLSQIVAVTAARCRHRTVSIPFSYEYDNNTASGYHVCISICKLIVNVSHVNHRYIACIQYSRDRLNYHNFDCLSIDAQRIAYRIVDSQISLTQDFRTG